MFPIAVKGHMPFGPNYKENGVIPSNNNKRTRSFVRSATYDPAKMNIMSCPTVAVEMSVANHRQRSKSATYLDYSKLKAAKKLTAQQSKGSSNSQNFRAKIKSFFAAFSSNTATCPPPVAPTDNSTPDIQIEVVETANDVPECVTLEVNNGSNSTVKLHRSFSVSTPQNGISKLDSIIEVDEAVHHQPSVNDRKKLRAHQNGSLKFPRPVSLNADRKGHTREKTFQQLVQWSDSESSCESIKDLSRM